MPVQLVEYYIDILEFLDQLSDVEEFYMRVYNLRDLILELDSSYKETYFLACFIQGLKSDLKEYVLEANPETLLAAYELALCREGELQPGVEELDKGCRPEKGVVLDSVSATTLDSAYAFALQRELEINNNIIPVMLVDDHSVNAPFVSVVDMSTKGNIALGKQGDVVALDIAILEEGYREFRPSNFGYLGSVFFSGAPQVVEDLVAMFKLTEIRLADSLTLPKLGGTGSFCYNPGIVLPCTISLTSMLLGLVVPLIKCYNSLGGSVIQVLGKTMAWSRGDSGRHIFKGFWLLWYIINLNNGFRSGLLEISWCDPLACFNNEQGGTFAVAGYDSSNDNMSYVCFIRPTATGQDSCMILATETHGCNAPDSTFFIRTHTIIQVSAFLYYVPAAAHKHGICSVLETLYVKFLKAVSSSFVHKGIALCSGLQVHDADNVSLLMGENSTSCPMRAEKEIAASLGNSLITPIDAQTAVIEGIKYPEMVTTSSKDSLEVEVYSWDGTIMSTEPASLPETTLRCSGYTDALVLILDKGGTAGSMSSTRIPTAIRGKGGTYLQWIEHGINSVGSRWQIFNEATILNNKMHYSPAQFFATLALGNKAFAMISHGCSCPVIQTSICPYFMSEAISPVLVWGHRVCCAKLVGNKVLQGNIHALGSVNKVLERDASYWQTDGPCLWYDGDFIWHNAWFSLAEFFGRLRYGYISGTDAYYSSFTIFFYYLGGIGQISPSTLGSALCIFAATVDMKKYTLNAATSVSLIIISLRNAKSWDRLKYSLEDCAFGQGCAKSSMIHFWIIAWGSPLPYLFCLECIMLWLGTVCSSLLIACRLLQYWESLYYSLRYGLALILDLPCQAIQQVSIIFISVHVKRCQYAPCYQVKNQGEATLLIRPFMICWTVAWNLNYLLITVTYNAHHGFWTLNVSSCRCVIIVPHGLISIAVLAAHIQYHYRLASSTLSDKDYIPSSV